jgi:hypothetical protein
VRVGDGDAEARPLEELDVVLAVAEGDDALGAEPSCSPRKAIPVAFVTSGLANSRKYGTDLEM